jgi:murein L,D-transpeptidase YafK
MRVQRSRFLMVGITMILAVGLYFTAPLHGEGLPALPLIDHIVVDKSQRTMALYSKTRRVHVIEGIQLGDAPVGPKRYQGDERTPEGRYRIDFRNPESAYHLSLRISYPNDADRAFASRSGRSPGGDIFIHGQPNGWPARRIPGDWTDGCIAVSNEEMDALWKSVLLGATIDIFP